jgi:hypothetical protein
VVPGGQAVEPAALLGGCSGVVQRPSFVEVDCDTSAVVDGVVVVVLELGGDRDDVEAQAADARQMRPYGWRPTPISA